MAVGANHSLEQLKAVAMTIVNAVARCAQHRSSEPNSTHAMGAAAATTPNRKGMTTSGHSRGEA